MQSKKYLKNLPKYFSKKKSQNIPFLDSEPLKTPVMRLRQTPAAWLQLVSSDNRRSVTCTENMKDKTNYSSPLAWKHPVVHSAVLVVLRSTFLFCEWNDNRAAILFWLFSGCSCSWLIRGWRPVTTRPSLRADTTSIYMKAPQWEDLIKVKVTVCQAVKWGSSARSSRPWLRCFHLVCLRI